MNDNIPNNNGPIDGLGGDADQARIDQRARVAGSELRRPAPEHGLAGVHRVRRHRQVTRAAVGSTAVLALVVGGIVGINNRNDGTEIDPADSRSLPSVADPSPETTDPQLVTTDPEPVPSVSEPVPTASQPVASDPGPQTTEPSPSPTVSDEVLPDPLAFAADGFEREVVDKTIVVRSDPEQVIPIDVPESSIHLYGVGPNGVAYLRVEEPPFTSARVVAVPTSGPTSGAVYELIPPFTDDGPWLGSMASDRVDLGLISDGLFAPFVDVDGSALEPSTDPTFTWRIEYRYDDIPGTLTAVFIDETTDEEYELPERLPTMEGQFDGPLRPLPDGRVTLRVIRNGDTPLVWALTPATGTWTEHPDSLL